MNTEPQGIPEALNRFFGKLLKFPRRWRGREELEPTKKGCLFDAEQMSKMDEYAIVASSD